MFSATNWRPSDTETQCIEVTYGGTLAPPSPVVLSAAVTNTAPGDGLADDLDVEVSMGTVDQTCDDDMESFTTFFRGTLAALGAGVATWTPVVDGTPDTMRPMIIRVTLGVDTPDTEQGNSAAAEFIWTATS